MKLKRLVRLEMYECQRCDTVRLAQLACVHMCMEGVPRLECPHNAEWKLIKKKAKEVAL